MDTRSGDRPPRRRPGATGAGPRRRVWLGLLAALVLAALAQPAWTLTAALTVPGSDGTAARVAEWARNDGLGGVITWLEGVQYALNPPPVGGTPAGGVPRAGATADPTPSPARIATTRPPAPITPLATGPALPGEGRWQTVVDLARRPAVRVAYLRPDAVHTSQLAAVMWLDPHLVSGRLHPGYLDPGGTWNAPTDLSGPARAAAVAAFNGGFRLRDSHGGYYSEGRTVRPLVDGAASLVLHTDGTATVGSWNREVRMGPDVASVRQNLTMLVDNAAVNPSCATGGEAMWGRTIGNAAYIDRSGFGVTASGAEVYVGGHSLSVCSLGRLLQAAGVVRGMELDINPAWVSGAYYTGAPGGTTVAHQLYPGQRVTAGHYFQPSSRDWYSWTARTPRTARTGSAPARTP